MGITREDHIRMERAHVLAWPALNTTIIDGWLWRSSGGASQRANSVSTIDFHGSDPEAAITQVEEYYRAVGAPARFQTFDDTCPSGLAGLLGHRKYREGEPTVTMFKRCSASDVTSEVEVRDHAWSEWRTVYLNAITEDRRPINAMILDRTPEPRAFFGYRRGQDIVATALCVIGFGCAVIECVATRPDARRQRTAQSALTALERWAAGQGVDWISLQVVLDNLAAVRLYEGLGFLSGSTNRFWTS